MNRRKLSSKFSETAERSDIASTCENREVCDKKQPIDWEIPRKVLHGSIGFITLSIYFLRPPSLSIIVYPLTGGLAVVALADLIRLRNRKFEQLYESLLGPLMRETEKSSINGVVWYLIGVIFVLVCYPRDIAVVSILLLSWADTNASTFGRLYGHRTRRLPPRLFGFLPLAPRKSLAGFLAASATGLAVAGFFWGLCTYGMGNGVEESIWTWSMPRVGGLAGLSILSVGAGFITGVVEALDLGAVDDNVVIPVLGGGGLWLLAKIMRFIALY